MKILSILSYVIGSLLLIISCLTASASATWVISSMAMVLLIAGCVFQFAVSKHTLYTPSVIRVQSHNLHKR